MPTAAAVPPQVGNPKLVQGSPYFPNYLVVDDTWKEKDDTQMLMTRDGNSNVDNFTFWSPGIDAQCDWMIKNTEGAAPATKGMVIQECAAGGGALENARSFIITDVETSKYGGTPLRQTVKLAYYLGFTPTVNEG